MHPIVRKSTADSQLPRGPTESSAPTKAPYALPSVGADDSVRPQNAVVFSETYGESAASSRADVGIGPYRVSANSHCPTNTHHKRKKEST